MTDIESDIELENFHNDKNNPGTEPSDSVIDESRTFLKAINSSVATFLRKCKYNSTQISIFQKYLSYGGIELDKSKRDEVSDSNDSQKPDFVHTIYDFFLDHFINDPFYISIEQHREAPFVIKKFIEYIRDEKDPLIMEYKDQLDKSIDLLETIQDQLIKSKFLALNVPGKYDFALNVNLGGTNFNMFQDTDINESCLEELESDKSDSALYFNEYTSRFKLNISSKINEKNYKQPSIRHVDMKVIEVEEDILTLEELKLDQNDYTKRISLRKPTKFKLVINKEAVKYVTLGCVLIGSYICVKEDGDNSLFYVNDMYQILPPFVLGEY